MARATGTSRACERPLSTDAAQPARHCDHAALSQLIGDIYDTTLDPTSWTRVLAKLAHFVGGQAAGLLSKDTISKAGNAYFFHGLDPAYQKSYAQTYWRHDPMAELASCEVEQIVSISELIPHHVFRRSVFYQQWSRPQGWIDAVKAVLDKSATSFAYLSVCRNEASGLVDSEMRARMALVVPHVRRATVIGKVIDLRRAEAAAFADVLDGLSAGVFLVDAKGMIMHANVAARAQLEAGTVLHAVQGQLIVIDPASNRRLRDMITATGGGDAAIGNTDVALALPAPTGDHHVAHVLPLTAGKRADAATPGASAAVFVRKAELQGPSSPQTIGALYRLTPAELRVLLAVVDVGGVPEVAAALGVADSTIKTHLGRIFEKTGANRQADLVKLVAGFSTPLAS